MKAQQTQSRPNLALRRERERRHWTQSELALRIGATYLTVCRWENGTTRPSLYYRKQLCEVFGLPPEALGLAPEDNPTRGAEPRGQPAPTTVQAVWQVPFRRNPFFTGREAALARLALLLGTGKAAALSGLGGVGKTQVALEYAYRSAQDYQAVFWLRADSRDALATGFLEIAHALNLPERDVRDQAIIVTAVRGWFSQHTNWLLILDNADDLAFLPEFLPAPLQGHLLLTTRAQALGGLASRLEIETLDLDTGPLLLLRRAGLLALDARLAQAEQTDWQAAVQLSQELGGLPLALDQAGAYLEETHCGLQQYLHLYRSHRADLLRQRGGMAQDHPDSVATIWALSFAQVEQRSPLAADLLRLCAWLHPDAIPEELFLRGAAHLGPALAVLETNPLAFNQALAVIQSYSLLRRAGREQMLAIHRLVQAVLQDAMTQPERDQWTARAIGALDAVFPEVRHQRWEQLESCGRLLPHVLTLAAVSSAQTNSLELAAVLVKAADYLLQRAQFKEAESLYLRALHLYEQTLGDSHPQVAFPLSGLAEVYREQGHYEEAEPLYLRALRLWEQTTDGKHPEMAYTLNNLAILHCEQGQFQQAEPLLQRALHLWEQTHDLEQTTLVNALNNLAVIYCEQGQFQQAEPLLQRALRLDEQMYGPEHPETTFPLTNLADLNCDQGRYAEAEPLYLRALHIREQALGGSHPLVAFPLNGLANLYREQGRYAEAEPLYLRALAIREQKLEPDHYLLAETLHSLALYWLKQERYDKAEPLFQRALVIRERAFGPQHRLAAMTLDGLAQLAERRRQYREALALYQRALAIYEETPGPDHPETVALRERFARLQARSVT